MARTRTSRLAFMAVILASVLMVIGIVAFCVTRRFDVAGFWVALACYARLIAMKTEIGE